MQTSNGLRRLIGACIEDERTLLQETAFVDERRQVVLTRLATERAAFAERLRALGEPGLHTASSWPRAARRLARRLRVLVGGPNNGDAISECRRSRDRTEALYDRAVGLSWPGQILPTLVDQRDRLHHDRTELISLQF